VVATKSKIKDKSTGVKRVGTVYVVASPIGNSGDWTSRAKEILSKVSLVAAEDTRLIKRELSKVKISIPKVLSHHEHNEETSTKGLLEFLENGEDIALVSDAGTPLISDPGYRLLEAAYQLGAKVVPVPGPSSLTRLYPSLPWAAVVFILEDFYPPKLKHANGP
jgi:16S rRNA (cytidine1402-2'-O)-methyltransferase